MKVVCMSGLVSKRDEYQVYSMGLQPPEIGKVYEAETEAGLQDHWGCKHTIGYVIPLISTGIIWDASMFREIDEPENESVEETNTTSCPATSPLI
jgi:hypothetical protein